jgi:hypothetical protein
VAFERVAEFNSTIQQIENLRYERWTFLREQNARNWAIVAEKVIPHPHGKSILALSMEDNELAEQALRRHQFRVLHQADISR